MKERKNKKGRKVKREGKLPFGFTPVWASRSISLGVGGMFVGQITFYATNVVGLNAAVVGTLLMASKFVDAFTDMIVGFIVDKTDTKLGKGRPYEVFIIPYWISILFLFSTPLTLSNTGKMIYIFALYTLAMSVFQTLLAGAETVYLGRAVPDQQQLGGLMAKSGVLVMFIAAVASMLMPQLIGKWGHLPNGWAMIARAYAIPMAILGIVRFFFVKEQPVEEEVVVGSELTLKESVSTLFKNKYILIFGGLVLLSWLIQGINSAVGLYYFTHILENVELMSLIGLTGLLAPLLLLLFPVAMRTIGSVGFVKVGLILAILGNVAKFFLPHNILIVVLGTFLSGVGTTTVTMLNSYFIVQCIEYGQITTGNRIEGLPTSFSNFSGKVGTGLASLLVGVIMSAAGFVGGAATQVASANTSIVMLYSLVPALFSLIMLILLRFFDVEKQLVNLRA